MFSRYLISIALLILVGFIIRRLLNQAQRQTVHETVLLSAKVIIIISLILLFWRLWNQ